MTSAAEFGGPADATTPAPPADAAAASSVRVAVCQFSSTTDVDGNLREMRALAERAAHAGAALVVFPEYSHYLTLPMDESWARHAEPLDGAFVTALGRLAADLGVHVVAGTLERADEGERFFNTLVAVAPDGEIVATYRKTHLYDAFGQRESDFVAPGELSEPELFSVGPLTVGLQTCYDLRFPEVTRRIVDAGAQLVLVPSEWVPGPLKLEHWRTLTAARAIENTVFLAAADHAAPTGVGASVILDPAGVELTALGDEPGMASADLDPARLARVRERNPALELRRYTVVER